MKKTDDRKVMNILHYLSQTVRNRVSRQYIDKVHALQITVYIIVNNYVLQNSDRFFFASAAFYANTVVVIDYMT